MGWVGTLIEPQQEQQGAIESPRRPLWGERAQAIRELVVARPDLTQQEVADRVGCVRSNVSTVMTRFLHNHQMGDLSEFQADKANIYDALQMRSLASITQADIEKASYSQRIVGAAILEDKARLVRGQATSINVNALLDVANLIREGRQ